MTLQRVVQDLGSKNFWLTLGLQLMAAVGALAALVQVWSVWVDDEAAQRWLGAWVVAFIVIPLAWGLFRAWPRPVEWRYTRGNLEVRIFRGDLFEQDAHWVIGMTTTFDTSPPEIADASLQGEYLRRVFSGDAAALDQRLSDALAPIEPEGSIHKTGKTDAYAVGSVAPISRPTVPGRVDFCLAYSAMNDQNKARSSVPALWSSLHSLWGSVRNRSNGEPVAMPVIGGGQSGLSSTLTAMDSVRLTVLSYVLESRSDRVNERLDIVVHPSAFGDLDMRELQVFLKTL